MLTIQFEYRHPQYDTLLSDLKSQLQNPDAQLTTDWVRFESNIHQQFPASSRNWRYWQFEQACFNQQLAIAEAGCNMLEIALRGNIIPKVYFQDAGIIATFHFGSYRILTKWLAVSCIKFVLVVSGKVKDSQQEIFHQQIRECLTDIEAFYILDANDPKIIIKIRAAIRDGYMVLLYVDGNVGGDHHLDTMSLFNSRIRVRVGAVKIAALLDVPLYRIYSNRSESALVFNLLPSVKCLNSSSPVKSEGWAGEMLFSNIKTAIHAGPYLWENWFYLDEFAV